MPRFYRALYLSALLSTSYVHAEVVSEDQNFWKDVSRYGKAQSELQKAEIEKQLWATYGKTTTVVVIDTSGFTLRSIDEGIISTLVVINELRNIITQLMKDSSTGSIIKFDADNAFLRFDKPDDALITIKKIREQLSTSYINKGHQHQIYISTGIGYGPILLLEHDAFSKTFNLASKLGEDTAEANEILLTEEAYKALKHPVKAEEKEVEVSHVKIKYYKIIE